MVVRISKQLQSIVSGISDSAYSWNADICIQMASGIINNANRGTRTAKRLTNSVSNIPGVSDPEEGHLSDTDRHMPVFMKFMVEELKESSKVVLSSIREFADMTGRDFTGLALQEISAGCVGGSR